MRNHRTTLTYDMPCHIHIYPKISFSYSPAYERFVPEWASNGIWSVLFLAHACFAITLSGLNCLRCQNISASKCGRVGKVKCIDDKWCPQTFFEYLCNYSVTLNAFIKIILLHCSKSCTITCFVSRSLSNVWGEKAWYKWMVPQSQLYILLRFVEDRVRLLSLPLSFLPDH
jgi:hypothetical protein